MTDPSSIVERGRRRTRGADFAALPPLTRRLGLSFEDATPPRHLTLPGAGGVRLHALDWGDDAPPALFLHGGRLTAQTWDYVWLGLRRRVRAVALELRGHGDSERTEDYAFDSHVADIGAVLDALAWPKAHLVGMSYGGLAAALFAAAAPQRVSVGPTSTAIGPLAACGASYYRLANRRPPSGVSSPTCRDLKLRSRLFQQECRLLSPA
jgi:pimeloyl-ACP methyl ester carboxylesterase